MSSKSSQEAMVAQVTNSRTSSSRYMIRPGSRSSESSEKCCKSSARRARGASSSAHAIVKSSMAALPPNQRAYGITPHRQYKIIEAEPLTCLPSRDRGGLVGGIIVDDEMQVEMGQRAFVDG